MFRRARCPIRAPSGRPLRRTGNASRRGSTKKRPLRLTKVHTLLVREHGLEASYDTLRRFASQQLAWRQKAPTVRVDDPPPGQEAQVDFGKMGPMLDPDAGRVRMLWALIVTLSFSRYQFVWPTFVQTTEAVCEGLDRAWTFFAAMIRTVVPDNMKAIVKTPDALTPVLVDRVPRLRAGARLLRGPGTHSLSEGQASRRKSGALRARELVRRRDLRGPRRRTPERRDVVPRHRRRTRARDHRAVPREVFESIEKPAMLPAPTTPFDVPLWIEKAKVHPDHHIQVARALYSVPSIHRNKIVRARADKTSVKIYLGTELIKMHPRQRPGGRSTDPSDYPSGKADYALRSVDGAEGSRAQQGHPRRHLRRATARRTAAVGADARRRTRSCTSATSTATAASKPSARARSRSMSSTSAASRACSRRPPKPTSTRAE